MDNETENKDDLGDAIVGAATGAVLSGAILACSNILAALQKGRT